MLLLGGGVGLAVVVIAGLFFWLRSPSPPPDVPPPPVVAPPPPQTTVAGGCGGNQGANNLYAKYLNKAKSMVREGNKKDACDYLKDIPQTSSCWAEAVELARQIDDCKLE